MFVTVFRDTPRGVAVDPMLLARPHPFLAA
jgi:hypothetical protein